MVSAIGLSGCAAGFRGAPDTTISAVTVSSCPVIAKNAAPDRTAYNAAQPDTSRRSLRNAFIDSCVAAIDTSYGFFAQGLSSDQKSFAIGSDFAASGITAAATLAKSATTKTHLTTYASLILGLRGSVDKELFLSKTLPALVTQMNASRNVVMVRIVQGKTRSDSEYSLDAALSDLKAYYTAGTLMGALTEVTNDAGVKNKQATEDIAKITTVPNTYDDVSRKLRGYWITADGKYDDAHETQMLECMGAGAKTIDLVNLMRGGTSAQKNSLIACLNSKGANL